MNASSVVRMDNHLRMLWVSLVGKVRCPSLRVISL